MRGQWRWEQSKLQHMPENVAALVMRRHGELIGTPTPESTSPYYVANQWLSRTARKLKDSHIGSCFDDEAINTHADNYANLCGKICDLGGKEAFAKACGIAIDEIFTKKHTPEGRAKRLNDSVWWRRQLRKSWTRNAENALREMGVIRKHREPYASNSAVAYRRAQKRRVKKYLQSHEAVNEAADRLDMVTLQEKSLSNPVLRRGEFMTRVRGFEEIAQQRKHAAIFVTVTAPSAFHAQLAHGQANPLWNGSTVREAQAWLCKMWARTRARWKRKGYLVYGFRIAEPHHDGTPHWHMLLFARQKNIDEICADIRAKWLAEFANEKGADHARVKFERIDSSKGSATGYIAKYVSKNIDGAGAIGNVEDTETTALVLDGVARVDAWASISGIRQFTQIGGPPVGLWREARRLREPTADPDIERARLCADHGRWAAFCYAVGGELLTRKTSLRLVREHTGRLNRYGEHTEPVIEGLSYASARVYTRPHHWRIVRKGAALSLPSSLPLGPVAITVRRDQQMREVWIERRLL